MKNCLNPDTPDFRINRIANIYANVGADLRVCPAIMFATMRQYMQIGRIQYAPTTKTIYVSPTQQNGGSK
jgi:hypothetical protein